MTGCCFEISLSFSNRIISRVLIFSFIVFIFINSLAFPFHNKEGKNPHSQKAKNGDTEDNPAENVKPDQNKKGKDEKYTPHEE